MGKGQAVLFDALPALSVAGDKPASRVLVREMVIRYRASEDYRILGGLAVCEPRDIANIFLVPMKHEADEVFIGLYLDGHNKILHYAEIARGTPNQAVPHVRNVLRPALVGESPAVSVAVIHNHPSGGTTPSAEDKRFTNALKAGCEALEVKLVDHIIIGNDKFYSFAEGGEL